MAFSALARRVARLLALACVTRSGKTARVLPLRSRLGQGQNPLQHDPFLLFSQSLRLLIAWTLLAGNAGTLCAREKLIPHDERNLSLRNEVGHAIDTGLEWLHAKQDPSGFWSSRDFPALTALALCGFLGDPSGSYRDSDLVKRGYAYLESCAHPKRGGEKLDLRAALASLQHRGSASRALLNEKDPEMGDLYSYSRKMAEALSNYGADRIQLADGTRVDWRTDLAKRLINLQNGDGSWGGPDKASGKNNPVLATSYGVLTMEILYRAM